MLISVIIPVYNHAHTLAKCLNSVLAQTYKPVEIIIVDDGSTDEFDNAIFSFLKDRKESGEPIVIFKQENRGAPAARNRGFAESKGDYVIFWDADTVAKPEMLVEMSKTLQDHPEASYAYSKFKFGCKKMQSHNYDPELLKKINYIDTTSLLRRSDFPGWDETIKKFQDWDLWLTLLEKNKTGIFIPEVLYKKIVRNRKGISSWLPSFVYKLPWKINKVEEYDQAKEVVLTKHGIKEKLTKLLP